MRLFFALLFLASSLAGEALAPSCQTISFPSKPQWFSTGAWSQNGEQLVLADRGAGELRLFDTVAKSWRIVAHPGQGDLEFNIPLDVHAVGSGFLLLDGQSHWLWLDRDLQPVRSLRFEPGDQIPGPASEKGLSFYGFSEYQSVKSFAHAFTYLGRGGKLWRGYVKARLEPLSILELHQEIVSPVERDYLLTTSPALAVVNDVGYALRFGEPRIERLGSPGARLAAFPKDLVTPALPVGGPETTVPTFRLLASASVPRALFGRGAHLYLLVHRPDSGSHRWELVKIDPMADRIVTTITLPASSPEITVVPGPLYWAIVERGPVEGVGVQEMRALTLVPTGWIEGSSPSPLANGKRLECREVH